MTPQILWSGTTLFTHEFLSRAQFPSGNQEPILRSCSRQLRIPLGILLFHAIFSLDKMLVFGSSVLFGSSGYLFGRPTPAATHYLLMFWMSFLLEDSRLFTCTPLFFEVDLGVLLQFLPRISAFPLLADGPSRLWPFWFLDLSINHFWATFLFGSVP